jgi:hypothetical protein
MCATIEMTILGNRSVWEGRYTLQNKETVPPGKAVQHGRPVHMQKDVPRWLVRLLVTVHSRQFLVYFSQMVMLIYQHKRHVVFSFSFLLEQKKQ